MRKVLLNVGTERRVGDTVSASEVRDWLQDRGFLPVHAGTFTHKNDVQELTHVFVLTRPLSEREAYQFCHAFGQDAIAQFDGRKGELLGPKAADWGPFNPVFFLDATGKPLENR